MAERLTNIPEREHTDAEALERAGRERDQSLKLERERAAAERNPERSVERSVAEAKEAASKAEKKQKPEPAHAEKRRDTPAQRRAKAKASYKATMKETQAQLSAPARTFSKVIHNPAVERTSEAVGSTVARPNAILAGSLTAFLFTLAIYVVARHYGYPLSGFETIAAFIVGWAVGLLVDYLRVMITGKKA
jgi:FtsZ-interacting cell division protein ZipA